MPGAVIGKDVPVTPAQPVSVNEKEPLRLPLKDPLLVVNKSERRLDLIRSAQWSDAIGLDWAQPGRGQDSPGRPTHARG
jgi:hypothetical protein